MRYFSLFLVLVWAGTLPAFSQVSNDNEDEVYKVDSRMGMYDFVPGQVLVKFKDESGISVQRVKGKFKSASVSSVNTVLRDFDVDDMEKLLPNETAKPKNQLRRAKAFNGQTIEERNLDKIYLVKLNTLSPDSTLQLVERLRALQEVEYAEPNYRVYITGECSIPSSSSVSVARKAPDYSTETTDAVICDNPEQNPLYSQQWGIKALNLDKLWTKPIINRKRPVIAILDTGVDITHPDLADHIWTNLSEHEGEAGYDDDNNGIVDDTHGYDFVNNYDGLYDKFGHGTHVAGIAAACNNETGIVGANPQALIMPVKVLDDRGSGDWATVARGILYAANNGADVINMSFGGRSLSNTLKDALDRAFQTSILVAGAGNDGSDIYNKGTSYPAAYYTVLGVQATSSNGNLAGFSNYDSDGPTYSEDGIEGKNYELKAPGVEILSTYLSGDYRNLNGTSMASPMVAGAISALKMVKEYGNNEALWGDLIHTNCDFSQAYDATPVPFIDVVAIDIDDQTDGGNGDGMVDAGETVRISPVLRNTWGTANNIKLHIEVNEDKENLVDIQNNDINFGWTLSAYGHNVSENGFIVRIKDNVADGTGIKFTVSVSCDNLSEEVSKDVILHVSNVVKLGGTIAEDLTLTADKNYVVTQNLGVPEGVTLTIEPGTKLRFYGGKSISVSGNIIAEGIPGSPILFDSYDGSGWPAINSSNTLKYCIFMKCTFGEYSNSLSRYLLENCVLQNCIGWDDFAHIRTKRCNIISSINHSNSASVASSPSESLTNYVNNNVWGVFKWSGLKSCNFFNAFSYNSANYPHHVGIYSDSPIVDRSENPSYLGSGKESIVRNSIYDYNDGGFGSVDLSNMLTEPVAEAHGIVWKVEVDGYDAQDEYEMMPPLGVGNHIFQVYFNRTMNKNVAPQISFGVREPYTQVPVNLNGRWSSDGKIYTAFVKITGKTSSDGFNTIYVYGAEDDEFFEAPYEKTRFHINVQSAGSMATGFAAEAGMGKVNLTWNNDENDFEDAMGFNIYRYTIDEAGKADTIRINDEIVDIETTAYTDYDVVPGTTYYYLYRVLSTDLQEYDVSNVVAVTPLTSTNGDANGSGDVDVADVITTVNYAAGQQPKPFIFEAADMNEDLSIDILDVIGIIKQIMNPNAEAKASVAAVASYTIEDGVVYVDSPVEIAGVQVQLSLSEKENNEKLISVAEDMKGFEHTSAWLSDNDYLFLGYNMNGKKLTAGKHAILIIGDAQIADIRLSDRNGHNIIAESTTVDKIDRMARDVMTINGIYDLQGRKISGNASDLQKMPKGVYIVNGVKVIK